jgi:hypothetical protein
MGNRPRRHNRRRRRRRRHSRRPHRHRHREGAALPTGISQPSVQIKYERVSDRVSNDPCHYQARQRLQPTSDSWLPQGMTKRMSPIVRAKWGGGPACEGAPSPCCHSACGPHLRHRERPTGQARGNVKQDNGRGAIPSLCSRLACAQHHQRRGGPADTEGLSWPIHHW